MNKPSPSPRDGAHPAVRRRNASNTVGQATAQSTPGEIQELVDHPQCARRARGDAGGCLVLDLGQCPPPQDHVGCRENRSQRVGQVVGEHSDEELADLLRRFEDVDFGASGPELRGSVVSFAASLIPLAAGIIPLPGRNARARLVVVHASLWHR